MGLSKLDRHFRRYARTGDVRALATVFDLAAPELMRVGRHLCGDEAEAEDAVQATFETAIEKAGEHDGERAVMPWLLGVLAIHARRARERAGRTPDPQRLAARLPEREVADPADLAADAELRSLVEQRVDELPETYATTLRRYLTEGASAQEIAQGLGLSAGAVHVRIHRGLKLLRRALPVGASLGGALTTNRARGLESLRAEVLQIAGDGGATITAPASVGAALAWKSLAAAASLTAIAGLVVTLGPWDAPRAEGPIEAAAAAPALASSRTQSTAGDRTITSIDMRAPLPDATGGDSAAVDPDEALYGGLTADQWLARFTAAEGWRQIVPLGDRVAALPDSEALALMRAIYHRLPSVDHRQQVLKSFVFHGGEPYALEILDLAANDPSLAVQGWAWDYLQAYAFVDFSLDPGRYPSWRERTAGRPLADVLREGIDELVTRLSALSPDVLAQELDRVDEPDPRIGAAAGIDLPAALREAGLQDLLARSLHGDDPERIDLALRWIAVTEPDEAFLRSHVLTLVDRVTDEDDDEQPLLEPALHALGQSGQDWVAQELTLRLQRDPGRWLREDELFEAIGDIGDPRVVPDLVDFLSRHDDSRTRYLLGYLALSPLTGVDYDEGQDAAFWLDWLESNRERVQAAIDARAR
ncbi:RNA polymerase sigma factor [Engelhardtia mirabilis]|uniref:ECF RNA polymerase sigma factor SigW n=1 Tax=Engelhardtia mirabilis TaxID=2528011 RepID=A0A518BHG6_9BACT|nr:ECF RNA polymerase sigma factor SigW [Planctomycetes bacterium Pla133]QDV00720.1 ECF RNA polymerase sigma factor SigW [Planctomycetes bacterium Pla86]